MFTALATEYRWTGGTGAEPEEAKRLHLIADAGFPGLHWCYQWCSDYCYSLEEMHCIRDAIHGCRLEMLDLHASHGTRCHYYAPDPDLQKLGVGLLQNRLELLAHCNGSVAVLHPPILETDDVTLWDGLRRGIDRVEPFLRQEGLKLAFENQLDPRGWETIERLLDEYGAEVAGLCYDAGHGNLAEDGLKRLNIWRDRLIAVHLHDNDGEGDQHKLPFDGTVDWQALCAILKASSWEQPLTLEVDMAACDTEDEAWFVGAARQRARDLARMVAEADPAEKKKRFAIEIAASLDAANESDKSEKPPITSESGLLVDPIQVVQNLPDDFRVDE